MIQISSTTASDETQNRIATVPKTPSSSRVKLVYVTTAGATQWSFLLGQNRYMADRGFELHAVAGPDPWLQALAERDGVETHAVPIERDPAPWKDLVALCRLYRTLSRLRPDIVHVSTPKAALLGALAAWVARVPVRVFLVRGLTSEKTDGWQRWLFRRLERLTARLCHVSVCVAPSLLAYARRAGILDENQGTVIANGMSNGVDSTRFDPARVDPADLAALRPELKELLGDPETVVIGFVGRLALDKGLEELAEAWQSLRETHPQTVLLLVGRWQKLDRISKPIRRRLEADPRVVMTGRVEDPAPYYKCMDIFVFPSHGTEGFPNAPMEARSMGLPVIATDVVGCVDAVADGVTGALVPPCDAQALTTAIRTYLDDTDLRRRHGQTGREGVIRDFRPERIWEGMYLTYQRLLQQKGIQNGESGARNGD